MRRSTYTKAVTVNADLSHKRPKQNRFGLILRIFFGSMMCLYGAVAGIALLSTGHLDKAVFPVGAILLGFALIFKKQKQPWEKKRSTNWRYESGGRF